MCHVCVHEAGHIVVGVALGFEPCEIIVSLIGDGLGRSSFANYARLQADPATDLVVRWAGIAAECHLMTEIPAMRKGWEGDYQEIRAAYSQMIGREVTESWDLEEDTRPYKEQAERIVRINQSAIDAIAQYVHSRAEARHWKPDICISDKWFRDSVLPLLANVKRKSSNPNAESHY